MPSSLPTLERSIELVTSAEVAPVTPATCPQKQAQPVKKLSRAIWGVFSSTFLTIFLAEMGDKTQVATLLMSAQSQSPWIVFAGAATALIATSLIGVLLGRWLANKFSPKTLDRAAGLSLLFVSLTLLWDVMQF